jgi:hypothetical protein
MPRITIHEESTYCRLVLAGRLKGPRVLETEYAWRSSLRSGRQIEVDMRQLTGVDDAGRELLLAMHLVGVRLVVEGVWIKALVEEITGNQPIDGTMGQSRKKKVLADQCSGSRRNAK